MIINLLKIYNIFYHALILNVLYFCNIFSYVRAYVCVCADICHNISKDGSMPTIKLRKENRI